MSCETTRHFHLPDELVRRVYGDELGIVRAVIPPAEFLRLAQHTGIVPGLFNPALVAQWEEPPYLWVDPDSCVVHCHEGRHRVTALKNSGYTSIEIVVVIIPDPMRFNGHLTQMLNWRWNGHLPQWHELRPEQEWHDALSRKQ